MRNKQFIIWCDKGMAFSFFALIYFLPISIALSELFTGLALFFYLLKRGAMFYGDLKQKSSEGIHYSFWKKGYEFLKAYKPVDNCLNWPIAIFLLFNFISVFLSQHPGVSFEGFMGKSLQSAFLYFNFVECINSKKRLKIFLTTLLISCLLICTNGFYQYFVGHGFIHGHIFEGRVASSLRQANDFAAYLVVMIPILLSLLVVGLFKQKQTDVQSLPDPFLSHFCKLKILTFIIFVLATVCLGLTYSRGAWIGFFLSLTVFGVTNRKVFLPFVLVTVIFFSVFYPRLAEKRIPINDKKSFAEQNNRLGYWKRASNIIRDYPVFGSGLNTYSLVSQRYTVGWGGYPHNSYLQLTSETGFIGISIFLWMLIVLFRCSFRSLKKIKVPSQKILLLGCLTGLLGFLIHSFFDTSFYSVQLGSLLWVTIGLVVAIQKIEFAKE